MDKHVASFVQYQKVSNSQINNFLIKCLDEAKKEAEIVAKHFFWILHAKVRKPLPYTKERMIYL